MCKQTRALCPVTISLDSGFLCFKIEYFKSYLEISCYEVQFLPTLVKNYTKLYVKDYTVNIFVEIKSF